MRVVFVIDSLGSGGAQRQLVLLFNALRALGVDCWIVYYQPHHHFVQFIDESDRGRVHWVGGGEPSPRAWYGAIRHTLRRLGPDTVVSFLRGASTLVAAVRASGLHFRWVASERAGQFSSTNLARTAAYLSAIRAADLVVPNSVAMADKLVWRGIPKRRIEVVPNGIPLDATALAAPVERSADPPRLLLVGTRVPEKNHPAIFEALGALRHLDWCLDHLGRTGEHPVLDREVNERIQRFGLQDRVVAHGRQRDVGRWYRQANLLVHPSLSEGFPNVVLEAWAWGCPVLVSDRCDLPLIVADGHTGLVASIDEPEGLFEALEQALTDPAALQRLAQRGRTRVVEEYAITAVAHRWLAVVDDLAPSWTGRLGTRVRALRGRATQAFRPRDS